MTACSGPFVFSKPGDQQSIHAVRHRNLGAAIGKNSAPLR